MEYDGLVLIGTIKYILVVGFNLPLWKMMEWKSVGMMTFLPETRHVFMKYRQK